ncbi:hypothetical protein HPB48_017615 [Haemaphysalis longicornis]|uniref:C2 domain-containing protein n=1 Tax=Haemaphysalis longicornis TaxID=44386 RepID=A0A9J6GPG6_HAELO|nr:hypothetical protein HPB48_017615 [Haemaphysalis longicornis]
MYDVPGTPEVRSPTPRIIGATNNVTRASFKQRYLFFVVLFHNGSYQGLHLARWSLARPFFFFVIVETAGVATTTKVERRAKDLPSKDFLGSSDPYIKLYLLPERRKKFQTRVHRKNLNPVFNESFVFAMPLEELRERTLQFSVYDFDRFSRNDLIGHVIVKHLHELCDPTHEMEYTMDIIGVPQVRELSPALFNFPWNAQ